MIYFEKVGLHNSVYTISDINFESTDTSIQSHCQNSENVTALVFLQYRRFRGMARDSRYHDNGDCQLSFVNIDAPYFFT